MALPQSEISPDWEPVVMTGRNNHDFDYDDRHFQDTTGDYVLFSWQQ